jgi:predicted dehydrogenase
MSHTPIKIGFVGVGSMGQCAHLRNYASPSLSNECEVVALAEIRPNLAREVAARYGVPRVYENHEQLLANEKLDAIVASQPFTRHGLLVPELAKAGIPIFTEKPIAGSIKAGETIVRTLEENNTWLMLGYHKRSDPATEYAKQVIEEWKRSREFGKMRYIRVSMPPGDWIAAGFTDFINSSEPTGSLEWDPAPDDMDEATAGEYTGFVNFYIHQVNLLRHLLGESYTVSYADPAKVLFVAHSASGVPCTIEMAAYNTTIDWQESAFVAFEKGYVKLELPAPLAYNRPGQVEIFKDPGNGAVPITIRPTLPWVHAMRNQALNFIKAVRGEAAAACLAAEGLEDIRIARQYIRLLKGK